MDDEFNGEGIYEEAYNRGYESGTDNGMDTGLEGIESMSYEDAEVMGAFYFDSSCDIYSGDKNKHKMAYIRGWVDGYFEAC